MQVDTKTLYTISCFEKDIAANPNDASAYNRMGSWWHFKNEYRKALDCYNTAIKLAPRSPSALCGRAQLLATCPDSAIRDGSLALRDAIEAVSIVLSGGAFGADWKARWYLSALVDAHAAVGDLEAAIDVQRSILLFAVTKSANRQVMDRLRELESLRDSERDA